MTKDKGKTKREWLEAALHEVRTRPWVQGTAYRPTDGAVCAEAALCISQTPPRFNGTIIHFGAFKAEGSWIFAYHAVADKAREITGDPFCSIADYNDKYARTKEDVIALFEKTIADCE